MAGSDPATDRQAEYIRVLFRDRQVGKTPEAGERLRAAFERDVERGELTRRAASGMIQALHGFPRRVNPTDEPDHEPVRVGVYALNGEVYVVKPNRQGTRLYAKRLVDATGDRVHDDGSTSRLETEYAPGVVDRLRPEHRMSGESVAELSARYGRCLMCGLRLKAARSVERMIGPVCWKRVS